MRFDPSILTPNPAGRRPILAIMESALDAVDPFQATCLVLRRDGDLLSVAGRSYDLKRYRRLLVVGAGKAGAPMAQAVEAVIGDHISDGLVVVKHGHGGHTKHVEIVEASHPRPDDAGVAAGDRIL